MTKENNTITTGSAVTYTMTGDAVGVGILPGGTAPQVLTIDLDGDASALLTVTARAATKTDGALAVDGIATHLSYVLEKKNADGEDYTAADMANVTASGTYRLTITLAENTPAEFADCTITYTLSLDSKTLS